MIYFKFYYGYVKVRGKEQVFEHCAKRDLVLKYLFSENLQLMVNPWREELIFCYHCQIFAKKQT